MGTKVPNISDRYEDLYPEEENIKLAKLLYKERDNLRTNLSGIPNIHRNRGVLGDLYEAVVARFIAEQIKGSGLKVIKGIIRKEGKPESPQVDIIVYREKAYPFYPQRGIGIVESSQVVLVVEVKGVFDTTSLPSSIKQLEKIKTCCNDGVKTCAWAFDIVMNSEENTIAEEFKKNNISDFVVIYKYTKKIWDYGSGLKAFIKTLKTLK